MERQAREIASWGDSVYVKIPVTNTRSESSCELIRRLSHAGVKLNVTALMTLDQVRDVAACRRRGRARLRVGVRRPRRRHRTRSGAADDCRRSISCAPRPNAELIWASPRELLNIFHADSIGCHIITVTHDILKKLSLVGYPPRRLFARYGQDVPRRCREGGVCAVGKAQSLLNRERHATGAMGTPASCPYVGLGLCVTL